MNELVLVDAAIAGSDEKALLHADRNGFLYALDRATGGFLYATQFVKRVNWTTGIDPRSGRPIDYDPESRIQRYAGAAPSRDKPGATLVCPAVVGGKNWVPMSYHPGLERVYIPVIESCNEVEIMPVADDAKHVPREWFTAGGVGYPEVITGSVTAVDVKTGRIAAKRETRLPVLGGVLTTAGGLAFVGLPNGDVVAFDAETLDELWRFPTGSGINAPVVSYAASGKQYIAIAVGLGGAMPGWWIQAVPGAEHINPSAMIFAFSL